jgi:hypothetical protein
MSASTTKKLYTLFVSIVLAALMSGCGWLDKKGNEGINKVFGNDPTCSGIVCP